MSKSNPSAAIDISMAPGDVLTKLAICALTLPFRKSFVHVECSPKMATMLAAEVSQILQVSPEGRNGYYTVGIPGVMGADRWKTGKLYAHIGPKYPAGMSPNLHLTIVEDGADDDADNDMSGAADMAQAAMMQTGPRKAGKIDVIVTNDGSLFTTSDGRGFTAETIMEAVEDEGSIGAGAKALNIPVSTFRRWVARCKN